MKPGDPIQVQKMFDRVAPRYDFLNDLFSLGLHRVWKRELLNRLNPSSGEHWLDLCCGTGDLALFLSRRVAPSGMVLGIDSAEGPLAVARRRGSSNSSNQVQWLKTDVINTGLPSNRYDGAVMAYGLRNLADPYLGLKELNRLLKIGSFAGILDFNHAKEGTASAFFQKFYLRRLVVPIASLAGLGNEYSYLEESLKEFPDGERQKQLSLKAGFQEATFYTLLGGQMGILLLKA